MDAYKANLVGTWKLLVATASDPLSKSGLAGLPEGKFARACRLVGQTQTFRKPDPDDILNGIFDRPLLETREVLLDSKEGLLSASHLKGGFSMGSLSSGALDVVEYYTKRGDADDDSLAPNRWSCSYLSETLRVCRNANGSRRVYTRVEDAEALEEMSRLGSLAVSIDPAMVAAFKAEEEAKAKAKAGADDDEDDPNDTRPMWQKRIDKADGIKRTKNGTPIINHGPIGGGGGPRPQQ